MQRYPYCLVLSLLFYLYTPYLYLDNAGDSLRYNNGEQFSIYDPDNVVVPLEKCCGHSRSGRLVVLTLRWCRFIRLTVTFIRKTNLNTLNNNNEDNAEDLKYKKHVPLLHLFLAIFL